MPLQAGDLVRPDGGELHEPVLWLSRGPAEPGAWAALRAEHARTGLWPLLLHGLGEGEDERRPWVAGELSPPAERSTPGDHSAEAVLSTWWEWHGWEDWGDPDVLQSMAPYDRRWPGLAPALPLRDDPDRVADARAEELRRTLRPAPRLGLVAAERGAEALTAVGWGGPMQFVDDIAELSAVVRSWEERFGARVVGVGFAHLHLSVAAPPRTFEEALPIAAEHVVSHDENTDLHLCARSLVDARSWSFWWD
ncbi:uncharacterized protein DUF4253 [Kineococcus xinjiangensis]|uniref:Uncharacterized protein DUF4253 n=1 Tax=Kineococcus xinjiangensis TaxID=512762 RepID=A0A2S6IWC2_9ACTN|nr:DUF4253 domain-containing protein [Kineococcus xinjiangensis]PPK98585.1 uncharacterized protein DUF4253 [Kineococcus xinjiangensis]